VLFLSPPFRLAIIACAASPQPLTQLRQQAGLLPLAQTSSSSSSSSSNGDGSGSNGFIRVDSIHIIGVDDAAKAASEAIARLFVPRIVPEIEQQQTNPMYDAAAVSVTAKTGSMHNSGRNNDSDSNSDSNSNKNRNRNRNRMSRQIIYMASGHAIGRQQRLDVELCDAVRVAARVALGTEAAPAVLPRTWKRVSDISSIAVLNGTQITLVRADNNGSNLAGSTKNGTFPTSSSSSGSGGEKSNTIMSTLASHPPAAPLLRIARKGSSATSYGQVLEFIRSGGDGDLRQLGVRAGEIVAYLAPPGGSAASALAFLSISAQTCAAPLSQTTTEPDALAALEQFGAKHVIIFEDAAAPIAAPGVVAAFKAFAATGRAKLHTAAIAGDAKPGIFKYLVHSTKQQQEEEQQQQPLVNDEDGVCLMLRTSGTTAMPKGVPLRQGQLVRNGAILAASIGLRSDDVCYGIMPLFHIGGISASILCSIAVGASITCDGPYNPQLMVEALVKSVPKPTWYSSVPTIHNATVAFLRDNAHTHTVRDGVWVGSGASSHGLRMIRSGAAALLAADGAAMAKMYGGIPLFPTYSMTEQMPISQPPQGMGDLQVRKPGSVGVPVAASCAIVNPTTLRPQPPGLAGEIAISGKKRAVFASAEQSGCFYQGPPLPAFYFRSDRVEEIPCKYGCGCEVVLPPHVENAQHRCSLLPHG
jgi:acyl-CoA synthetase (AMP-forming)/AMP-acid ligase II